MTPLYQNDRRWSSLMLGAGPSTIGRAGCVLTSLTMAARELGVRPDLLPPHANVACTLSNAFVGDELVVPQAALALGLLADEAVHGLPGDPTLATELLQRLMRGMAILRIDIDLNGTGDHSILAVSRNQDGTINCLCPAVGRVALGADLMATVDWGHKDKVTTRWVPDLKKYRVVGVRGLARPTH